jgi:hypothetical protein
MSKSNLRVIASALVVALIAATASDVATAQQQGNTAQQQGNPAQQQGNPAPQSNAPTASATQTNGAQTPPAPAPATPVAPAQAAPTLPPTTHAGQVVFQEQPVPGASVTATQGEKKLSTVTDAGGVYRFDNLAAGQWTIKVEMIGFAPITHEITIPAEGPPPTLTATLLPFDEIAKGIEIVKAAPAATATTAATNGNNARPANNTNARNAVPGAGAQGGQGFQRAGVSQTAAAPAAPRQAEPPSDPFGGAADGFVVNGSVNNGAASPFAQLAAFGNNRRGGRSLYNGGIGLVLGNSAWDARSYGIAQPSYNDTQFLGSFGGPLKLPWVRNDPQFTLLFQKSSDHNATTTQTIVPTAAQRAGDLSSLTDRLGRPIQLIDPLTGQPFAGNQIPASRLSPQAQALLNYYPQPNTDAEGGVNFQAPIVVVTKIDQMQTRINQPINNRNSLNGTLSLNRTTTDTTTLFGFEDRTESSGVDTQVNWQRRFGQLFTVRMRYQFTMLTNETNPFFANRTNVSGDAGITGNNQDPINWGPPSLTFASGIAGLSDALPAHTTSMAHAPSVEAYWNRGRHNLTFGGEMRRNQVDLESQQDPRGSFSFNGAATGSDLGDFLLGLPRTSAIAFGNADKGFRAFSYNAYITDDIRMGPSLTINAGLRWEYEAPMTELFGRLVNLDIAPSFTAASAVVASSPTGSITNESYESSLVRTDKLGFQPRLAMAWRPVPGSSLVIRAGYGIYRNTNVYQSLATLMAQQPPLSRSFSVETSPLNPLTLANGFSIVSSAGLNTFAVDPNFRVGFAQNWQASVQRDLPMSLTVIGTYLGTKGHRLLQESLPNTNPVGAANPCPTCPVGFVYLSSTGSSTRHAGQMQVRRRLRNGLTAQVQYTLAKAEDDATAFGGASLFGGAIAQDWRDLDAEWGPSSFDQRHLVNFGFQYTTGVGAAGGGLLDGWRGTLFKNWTITGTVNAGSGTPLTPVILTSVAGTGIVGFVRPQLTGEPIDVDGYYANPAAFTTPAPGTWGSAGRNSIRGPAQYSVNAGVTRTFLMGDRWNLDWRVDGTNILNQVTYNSIVSTVGSQQFGLPTRVNSMRKLTTTMRLRF